MPHFLKYSTPSVQASPALGYRQTPKAHQKPNDPHATNQEFAHPRPRAPLNAVGQPHIHESGADAGSASHSPHAALSSRSQVRFPGIPGKRPSLTSLGAKIALSQPIDYTTGDLSENSLPSSHLTGSEPSAGPQRKAKFGFASFGLFRKKKRQLPKLEVAGPGAVVSLDVDLASYHRPTEKGSIDPDQPTDEGYAEEPMVSMNALSHAPDEASLAPSQPFLTAGRPAASFLSLSLNEPKLTSDALTEHTADLDSPKACGPENIFAAPSHSFATTSYSSPNCPSPSPRPVILPLAKHSVGADTPSSLAASPHHGSLTYRRPSHRSVASTSVSIRSSGSTFDPYRTNRSSMISRYRREAEEACLGFEPRSVAATTQAQAAAKPGKVHKLGWFAVDYRHGLDIVSRLERPLLDALQVRLVHVPESVVWSHSHTFDGSSHMYSLQTAPPIDTILDHLTQVQSVPTPSSTTTTSAAVLLDSLPPRSSSTDLHSPLAGCLMLDSHLPAFYSRKNSQQPAVWWPGNLEDEELEEFRESSIKHNRLRRVVKAASLRALVFRLASSHETDIEFMNDFLRGYRFLAHPVDVLRLLVVRYLHCTYSRPENYIMEWSTRTSSHATSSSGLSSPVIPSSPAMAPSPGGLMPAALGRPAPTAEHQRSIIQIRVLNAIKRWLDLYVDDFKKFADLFQLLILFLHHIKADGKRRNFVDTMIPKIRERITVTPALMGAYTEIVVQLLGPMTVPNPDLASSPSSVSLVSTAPSTSGSGSAYSSSQTQHSFSVDRPSTDAPKNTSDNMLSHAPSDRARPATGMKKLLFGNKGKKKTDDNIGKGKRDRRPRKGSNSRGYNTRSDTPILSITDVDAKDLFHQLTLIEHEMFCQIPIDEFCYHGKCKDSTERQALAPNLNDFIRWFNKMSIWVAKKILTTVVLHDRVKLVQMLIHIAHQCLIWNNYNTCFEIVSGLTRSSVKRLHRTWAQVSAKSKLMLEQLSSIMSQRPNYKTYRACLRSVWNTNGIGMEFTHGSDDDQYVADRDPRAAARALAKETKEHDNIMDFQVETSGVLQMGHNVALLPFIGVHLTDLLYSDEGNLSYVDPNQVRESYMPATYLATTLLSRSSISRTASLQSSAASTSRRDSKISDPLMTPTSICTMESKVGRRAPLSSLRSSQHGVSSTFLGMMASRPTGKGNHRRPSVPGEPWLGSSTTGFSAIPESPLVATPTTGYDPQWPRSSQDAGPIASPGSELTVAHIGHFSHLPMINCSKLRLMSAMLQKIRSAQENRYPFTKNSRIQRWIRSEISHIFQSQLLPANPITYYSVQNQFAGGQKGLSSEWHDLALAQSSLDRNPNPPPPVPSQKPLPADYTTLPTPTASFEPAGLAISMSFDSNRGSGTGLRPPQPAKLKPDVSLQAMVSPVTSPSAPTSSFTIPCTNAPSARPWVSSTQPSETMALTPPLVSAPAQDAPGGRQRAIPPPQAPASSADFVHVGDDPEDWEGWLHKMSRLLEPPPSQKVAGTIFV
ncbi:hypothetical protein H4R34_002746 [Dimargaris verticillata]|uniref:Ras GEF n=1 Tax=Dimargaris verticillata TaxID=2761393 RepID=A0A9W8B883_9FUNG|nr:hypothetical protein H4R34_002746 [Dimargaris verticillata]